MSGFLPDIASWALGGGAGQGEAAGNDENGAQRNGGDGNETAISEEEMRAKRMARLAALEKKPSDDAGGDKTNDGGGDGGNAPSSSMDVEKPPSFPSPAGDGGGARPMEVDEEAKPAAAASASASPAEDAPMEPAPTKKIKSPPAAAAAAGAGKASPAPAAADPLAKLRRRKVVLLRRVLLVTFGDAPSDRHPSCVHLALDDDDIYNATKSPSGVQVRHVAELLAARLSLSPSSRSLDTVPPQAGKGGLVAYLGGCHKRAGEEWKELKVQGKKRTHKGDDGSLEEMCGILEEIRSQVCARPMCFCGIVGVTQTTNTRRDADGDICFPP